LGHYPQTLGLETGTNITIAGGGSLTANSGTLDGSGNRVFTVTAINFPNNTTFTINGGPNDFVVLNVASSVVNGIALHGNVVLSGGIASDHVLFNYTPDPSNVAAYNNAYANLTGGPLLWILGPGSSFNQQTVSGVFLDPTGSLLVSHSTVNGRVFGGDTHNSGIVSQVMLTAPTPPSLTTTPSATSITLSSNGTTLKDTANLEGGDYPTGTITFTLYFGNTLVDTEPVTVNGDGSYTTPTGFTLPTTGTVTGTYQWDATYSGDNYNLSVSDNNDPKEQVTVSPASPALTTTPSPGGVQNVVVLNDTATLSGGYYPGGSLVFTLYAPDNSVAYTVTDSVNGNSSYTTANTAVATEVGTYQWVVSYSGDGNNNSALSPLASEPVIVVAPPNLVVTKTADQSTITAGQTAGFLVTISNTGGATATGITLTDPLPAGTGNDVSWTIDTSGTGLGAGTTPTDFQITGSVGSQSLALSSSFINSGDSLAAGQTISVHITGLTYADDGAGSTNPALGVAANYAVLYEGTGGHNLQITNVTINGNIGVGGTGKVQFNGPGTISGRLDFSAANTGQFQNNNGQNVGPASANYNVAAVTNALHTVNNLSSSLAGLGNSLTINGTQTINESAGQLDTVNGVAYRIFKVTSYNENDGKLVTINGDGSGDPVVLNFGTNNNVNLGGDVSLTGGLTDDQVLWNFTSSGQNIQLNNNASSYPLPDAFHGVILAPNDKISLVNANLNGRVFGGNSSDMQIVSGDTINAPTTKGTLPNTATVSATGLPTKQASATVTISPSKNETPLTNVGLADTPSQNRIAYGSSQLALDGTGQTIAIVAANGAPPSYRALDTLDQPFGVTAGGATLYAQSGAAASFLTGVNEVSQTTNLPTTDPAGTGKDSSEAEGVLDVEWAHAIAPGAKMVLVEAISPSLSDLMAAVAAGESTALSSSGTATPSFQLNVANSRALSAEIGARDLLFARAVQGRLARLDKVGGQGSGSEDIDGVLEVPDRAAEERTSETNLATRSLDFLNPIMHGPLPEGLSQAPFTEDLAAAAQSESLRTEPSAGDWGLAGLVLLAVAVLDLSRKGERGWAVAGEAIPWVGTRNTKTAGGDPRGVTR
jgi:uncharacterized repeat protein (TIGR01451 family)